MIGFDASSLPGSIRRAKRRPIDRPIHSADKAGTAHDIAKRHRNEIVKDSGDRNG
jgi:hypothetical protein